MKYLIFLSLTGCLTTQYREREFAACRAMCGREKALSYSESTGECQCQERTRRVGEEMKRDTTK